MNIDGHLRDSAKTLEEIRSHRARKAARVGNGAHIASKSSGEFFTPDDIIEIMCLPYDFKEKDKTYIDISSGNGNILLYIIKRRLEHMPLYDAISNVYGTELMADNIEECKQRMHKFLSNLPDYDKEKVQQILDKNIVCTDTTKYVFPDKYDYVILNPPYSGQLYITFFNIGLDILKEGGKMVIICPSTWLINVRKTGNAKRLFNPLKERLGKNVRRVRLENYNYEFLTGLYMPFSITYIDKSREFEEIEFYNCSDEAVNVPSIYDCNLVGSYKIIWSILDKVMSYGDMMKAHVYKPEKEQKTDE